MVLTSTLCNSIASSRVWVSQFMICGNTFAGGTDEALRALCLSYRYHQVLRRACDACLFAIHIEFRVPDADPEGNNASGNARPVGGMACNTRGRGAMHTCGWHRLGAPPTALPRLPDRPRTHQPTGTCHKRRWAGGLVAVRGMWASPAAPGQLQTGIRATPRDRTVYRHAQ